MLIDGIHIGTDKTSSYNISKIEKTNFRDLIINFDAFGDTNFNYHNKIIFDIFAQNSRYAIAKGGCYNIKSENANIPAVGSTIYINFLLKI